MKSETHKHSHHAATGERKVSLGRRFSPSRKMFHGVVGFAPLLDVFLIGLLFVVLASSFIVQPGVIINLPSAPFTSGVKYGDLVVTVSQQGFIFFNDERTDLEGLAGKIARQARAQAGALLLIEADGEVPNSKLMAIYNVAVEAGIDRIALATRIMPAMTKGRE